MICVDSIIMINWRSQAQAHRTIHEHELPEATRSRQLICILNSENSNSFPFLTCVSIRPKRLHFKCGMKTRAGEMHQHNKKQEK